MEIRAKLARSTNDLHLALHEHALFAPLLCKGAGWDELSRVFLAFSRFFHEIEDLRERLEIWPDLTLRPEIDALAQDLGSPPSPAPHGSPIPAGDRLALLGALYVAHGATFGRSTLARQIPALAGTSRFLTLRTDPMRWRSLLACLELVNGHPEKIDALGAGANRAFKRFASLADEVSSARVA